MKTVYLLRHAKSSWDEAGLGDRDRPLSARGRRAGAAIARHISDQGIAPDVVLCSPAVRTRATFELIASALGDPDVTFKKGLYDAGSEELVKRLAALPDEVESAMVIGHNPSIQMTAFRLAHGGPRLAELRTKYPTGALATLSCEIGSWAELSAGCAELTGFVKPRELE